MPGAQNSGPLAYLTGEYPKVSHTFIQREIEALRALGLVVETFSIRRALPKDILADQQQEEANTFFVLDHCKRPGEFAKAHLKKLLGTPGSYFSALRLALRLRQPGLRSLLYQLFYFMEAVVLADELKRREVRHLHNHFGNSSCTVAMLASALSGVPFSFTEHGPAIFFEAERWRLDEKIARARFVVAISHFCRSQLMLFSNPCDWSKIFIVHCGVDPTRYAASKTSDAGKHVLYVGRLEPVKGLPVLLEAVTTLRSRHADMTVTVVGDGTARAATELAAQRLGLTDIVRFAGYKTQAEVAGLLADVDMLVLPSFAEGVPVVLMEAMASGKPVIASRVAGIQELVDDGVSGFAVPPGDAVSLAERMDQLMSSPALRDAMGSVGREIVSLDFNIKSEAAWLAQLFVSAPASLRPIPDRVTTGI